MTYRRVINNIAIRKSNLWNRRTATVQLPRSFVVTAVTSRLGNPSGLAP
jgi:hypothetical protein